MGLLTQIVWLSAISSSWCWQCMFSLVNCYVGTLCIVVFVSVYVELNPCFVFHIQAKLREKWTLLYFTLFAMDFLIQCKWMGLPISICDSNIVVFQKEINSIRVSLLVTSSFALLVIVFGLDKLRIVRANCLVSEIGWLTISIISGQTRAFTK